MPEPGADGGRRYSEDGSRLARGSVLDFAQHEGNALIDGKLIQKREQCRGKTFVAHSFFWRDGMHARFLAQTRQSGAAPGRSPYVMARTIGCNGDEERRERAAQVVACHGLRKRDESLLHPVLPARLIAEEAPGERPERSMVKGVGLRQGGDLAVPQAHGERTMPNLP